MGGKPYNFSRINKLSFMVEHEDRCSTTVELLAEHFEWKITVHTRSENERFNDRKIGYVINGYECNELISTLASGAMAGWTARKRDDGKLPWFGAKEWSTRKIKEAIAKRVSKYWRESLEAAYPKWFLDLHARIFSVTYRLPEPTISLSLLDTSIHDPYLVSDIMNYRAAAHALLLASTYERPDHPDSLFIMVGADDMVPLKDVLWQWTAVYDRDHVLNRSKRRTIMNMPAHMSTQSLRHFKLLTLDRPLLTKQQLTWACVLVGRFGIYNRSAIMENKAIVYPTIADLNSAIGRYAVIAGEPLSTNATKSYRYVADYLHDAIFSNQGRTGDWVRNARTVTSLFKTSELIHREINRRQVERQGKLYNYDRETETKLPPIPLPEHEAITFLDTAGAIADEGMKMQHCISGYAGSAVKGHVYIFHVEHGGQMATAAVSAERMNMQCHGPRNRQNKAAKLGQRILGKWSKLLAAHHGMVKIEGTMETTPEAMENLNRIAALPLATSLAEALPVVREALEAG